MGIADSKQKNGWGGQSKSRVNDGKWHHVVAVQDPWSKGGRIYVDGVKQPNLKVGKFSNKNGVRAVECGAPVIGRDLKTNRMQFKGKIDEVMIWRRTFTSKEVQTLSGGGDAKNADRLLLHYRFDTGKGSIAADSSLNGFEGAIIGKPGWSKGLAVADMVRKYRKSSSGKSTSAPSKQRTVRPTNAPSKQPTARPTKSPTSKPTYKLTPKKTYCSSVSGLKDIKTETECKKAAAALGLAWSTAYTNGKDHHYCLFANDKRKKVFFNKGLPGAKNPPNGNYQSLCIA